MTGQKVPNPETGTLEVDKEFQPQPDEMGNVYQVSRRLQVSRSKYMTALASILVLSRTSLYLKMLILLTFRP